MIALVSSFANAVHNELEGRRHHLSTTEGYRIPEPEKTSNIENRVIHSVFPESGIWSWKLNNNNEVPGTIELKTFLFGVFFVAQLVLCAMSCFLLSCTAGCRCLLPLFLPSFLPTQPPLPLSFLLFSLALLSSLPALPSLADRSSSDLDHSLRLLPSLACPCAPPPPPPYRPSFALASEIYIAKSRSSLLECQSSAVIDRLKRKTKTNHRTYTAQRAGPKWRTSHNFTLRSNTISFSGPELCAMKNGL